MTKVDSALIGAAGEHLVLSRLLSRGFLAAQAPRGARKADILVNFLDGSAPFLIQVKARSTGRDRGWHMNVKHETIHDSDLFYCFVDFEPTDPTVHVLPAVVVADVIRDGHQIWLDTRGVHGQPHNPTNFRRLLPESGHMPSGWMDAYLEAWNQLDPASIAEPQH